MTARSGPPPGVGPGTPVVRAPRAGGLAEEELAPGDSWLAQGALGLGAPALGRNGRSRGPAVQGARPDDPPQASIDDPAPALGISHSGPPPEPAPSIPTGAPSGRPTPALPTSPRDQDGMYRGLLWVARAIEDCSRAFTRVSSRLANLEGRLDRLDEQSQLGANAAQPHPVLPPIDEGRLEKLETLIGEQHAYLSARVDALEERLHQLDVVPLKVSNLQKAIEQLESAQRRGGAVREDRQEPSSLVELQLRELRRELAAAQRKLSSLEGRASEERLSAAVDAAVQRHAERFTGQVALPAGDIEGVYRELDAVAEFVAARSSTTAESLERIAPLEGAVLELRRDLARVLGETGSAAGTAHPHDRLDDLEARLDRLEIAGRKASRLFSALSGAVHVREPADEAHPPA